jgi:hypothetical protein
MQRATTDMTVTVKNFLVGETPFFGDPMRVPTQKRYSTLGCVAVQDSHVLISAVKTPIELTPADARRLSQILSAAAKAALRT